MLYQKYLFININKSIKTINNKAIGLMLVLKDHKVIVVILVNKPVVGVKYMLAAVVKGKALIVYASLFYILTTLGVAFRWVFNTYYNHIVSTPSSIDSTACKRYYIVSSYRDITTAHSLGSNPIQPRFLALNYRHILNKLIASFYLNIYRLTKETAILIDIWLADEAINNYINTSIGFFNHMINQIATHSNFRLIILARGDKYIDDHHIIEDVAISLGINIKAPLNYKLGISRFSFIIPMDECLSQCVIDLCNRFCLSYKSIYSYQKTGDINNSMIEHFFRSLSCSLTCSLTITTKGINDHHRIESLFKVFGIGLSKAFNIVSNKLPSSKGLL